MSRALSVVTLMVTILGFAATAAAPATAQSSPVCGPLDNGRIADVFYEGTAIFWTPVVKYEYDRMVLTISGPCEDIVKTFKPGEQIFFDLGEIQRVTDGSYSWQLRAMPTVDPAVREALQGARGSGEEDALWWSLWQKGAIQAGPSVDRAGFVVERGAIVDPGSGEESQKRAVLAGKSAGTPLAAAATAAGGRSDVSEPTEGDGNRLSEKDFVINDDLIVDGSACIGFDCVNGYSFGFDTVVVRENNLRIFFDDTSTAASFPRNDWRIIANDSANGGGSYFGVEDASAARRIFTLEAAAPSHSLYVDDGGRVGFGTSTPSVELHTVDGDTPTLRLQQDGSSGFAPQTWDVAGNETSFFVRDTTNGSKLPFRIFPDSPSNSLVIKDGDVGIGTTTPDYDLDIDRGTSSAANFVVRGTSGAMILQDLNATSGRQAAQNLVSAGTWRLRGLSDDLTGQTVRGITVDLADGDVGVLCDSSLTSDFTVGSQSSCSSGTRSEMNAGDAQFTVSSSRSMKEHLNPVEAGDILARIQDVSVYQYDFIEGPKDRLGLMAEDFHQVFERGSDKVLSGQEVQMALWLAVQELTKQNKELEERIRSLEGATE